jgi:hypothetical protein
VPQHGHLPAPRLLPGVPARRGPDRGRVQRGNDVQGRDDRDGHLRRLRGGRHPRPGRRRTPARRESAASSAPTRPTTSRWPCR